MQIPVLSGVYTDSASDFRTAYPRNLVPVPKDQGISKGYLRPADGIVQFGTGPGIDRGGINWNGSCYRVMGTSFVKISWDGSYTTIGTVAGGGQVSFDYSFDRLGIASGGKLYYYNGTTFVQVTDTDLGTCIDFIWVDGYFMSTDGTYLVVTELTDPTQVNPLKYGSSEANPDPIKAIKKLRNEVYALNRYTIEVFNNVGGSMFPFARVDGAQMIRGTIGTHSCAVFMEALAWLGGGMNEAPSVWMGTNSATVKIATREIDQLLAEYTEAELSSSVMEVRVENNHQLLYLHLPDRTLVYDGQASRDVGQHIWFELTSSIVGLGTYRARNFVRCYDKWLCGDPTSVAHGYLTNSNSHHYGSVNGWEFGTQILYNEGRGAIFNELELVCLTGNAAFGDDPTIWTSYTVDGQTWSQEHPRTAGKQGERQKRISWLQQGYMRNWRCQKFRGTSDSHMSIARLEARLEALNV
jgi:Phage stabilisation protein